MLASRIRRHSILPLVFAVAGLLTVGCGGGDDARERGFGSVTIEVRLLGEAPVAPTIAPDKNVEHCGASLEDPVLLVRAGLIAGAVVAWVEGSASSAPRTEGGEVSDLELNTKGCLLQPRIQTARAGSRITLQNRDTITHSPHGWIDGARTVFNLTLIDDKTKVSRTLRDPGVYRIDCDTHSWMRAYVHIFDHPFHAVTGQDGLATLRELPAGRHEIEIWHEVLGRQTVSVVVQPSAETRVVVEYELLDHRLGALTPPGMESWIPRVHPRGDRVESADEGDQ